MNTSAYFFDQYAGDNATVPEVETSCEPPEKKSKLEEESTSAIESVKDSFDLELTFREDTSTAPVDTMIVGSPPFTLSKVAYDFENPDTPHDAVLLVGGANLFVFREVLSTHSEFFKKLFDQEDGKTTFEVKGVLAKHFVEFLNHIYPNSLDITDSNLIMLMVLSDKFQSPSVSFKCASFLMGRMVIGMNGPSAMELLKKAIREDLPKIKEFFCDKVCTRSLYAQCKNCWESCACPEGHLRFNGMYLNRDNFFYENKDLIMKQEPELISFMARSLFDTFGPYSEMEEEMEEEDIKTEGTQASDGSESDIDANSFDSWLDFMEGLDIDGKPSIYDFLDAKRDHDAVLIAEGVKHYVQLKVLSMSCRWFNGRVVKGSELEIPNLSSKRLCFFLTNVYCPNICSKDFGEVLCILLIQLSIRFESTCLFNQGITFMHKMVSDIWSESTEDQQLDIVDMAVKYKMEDIKKFIYAQYQKSEEIFECWCSEAVKCHPTEDMEEHSCEPDGIWIVNPVGQENLRFHDMSSDVHKFILACVLGVSPF